MSALGSTFVWLLDSLAPPYQNPLVFVPHESAESYFKAGGNLKNLGGNWPYKALFFIGNIGEEMEQKIR